MECYPSWTSGTGLLGERVTAGSRSVTTEIYTSLPTPTSLILTLYLPPIPGHSQGKQTAENCHTFFLSMAACSHHVNGPDGHTAKRREGGTC